MINYSFIIPHHNCPALLNRLVDSIPVREDIEIIIVDDNSDDDKKPLINRSDAVIVLLTKQDSKGAGHARNVGLNIAKGKWLFFADSDDYYDDTLLSCVDVYVDSNIDILYFGAYMGFDVMNPSYDDYNVIDDAIQKFLLSEKNLVDIQRIGLSTNMPWNKMYRKSFISRIGVQFEEIPISNDAWFVNYAGSQASKISAIKNKLYYYTINPSGITIKKRPLEDHYISLRSLIRRNKLKAQYHMWDTMSIKMTRKPIIVRDYGIIEYYKYFMYRLFHDKSLYRLLFNKICSVLKNK